jgi:uncharacterized protein YfdQ (DUF2303 family)
MSETLRPVPKPSESLPAPTAVQELLAAGRRLNLQAHVHPHGRGYPYIVVKDQQGHEFVEYLAENSLRQKPDFATGTVPVDDARSFGAYFKEFRIMGSRVYASLNPLRFVGVINDHETADAPNWRDHRVVFEPKHSPEWLAWSQSDGKVFAGNVEWAEWLEDNHFDIVDPPGAHMLEIALNFRVNDRVAFSNPVRLANGRTEFQFQHLVDGHAEGAAGKIAIPEEFRIELPVWAGLDQPRCSVAARFRYRLKDGGLRIWYQLVRPHKVVERAFADLVGEVTQSCGQVLFGRPE